MYSCWFGIIIKLNTRAFQISHRLYYTVKAAFEKQFTYISCIHTHTYTYTYAQI